MKTSMRVINHSALRMGTASTTLAWWELMVVVLLYTTAMPSRNILSNASMLMAALETATSEACRHGWYGYDLLQLVDLLSIHGPSC